MSLHGKIVAWFAFFAAILVTLFVLGDYYQSTKALRVALEARANSLGKQAATDIERRYEQSQSELERIGHRVANNASIDTAAAIAGFASVLVFRDDSLIASRTNATVPADSSQCAYGSVPFHAEFRDLAGHSYRLEAVMSVSHFFAPLSATTARIGHSGVTAVFASGSGAVVYDNGCNTRSALVPQTLRRDLQAEVADSAVSRTGVVEIRHHPRDHLYLASMTRTVRPAWSVAVALDYDRWAEPFLTARGDYFAIMIAFMLVALLFTMRMIRNDMQRLTAISQAADAIGHGRFDVWLPPPTGDEVGRLSLALGQMLHRLGSTIRQMEASAALAAVGEMATYLSHEIRNPLSSIRLNLQMLRKDLRSGVVPADAQHLVSTCLAEMQRLEDVVNTVLDTGRRQAHTSSCDAHEVIRETVHVMHSNLDAHGISLDLKLDADVAAVAMNGGKLKSVMINLLVNSVEAMSQSATRRIEIRTAIAERIDGSEEFELIVQDSGPGVPSHLALQIFEQFFTTKKSGSGIGLTTVRRLVSECGGSAACVPTDEGTGGEFVLYLPLAHAQAAARSESLAAAV